MSRYTVEPLESRRKRFAGFLTELRQVCAVVEDEKSLLSDFGYDYSLHAPVCALAAVQPTSIEQVATIVQLCNKHKVPMTPRGTGTGVEGGAIPYAGGLVVDTAKLQRMDFDVNNAFVWVGAGVTKLQLLREARKRGFLFGPDPSSNPSVGGMVSTSGSGMSTLKYGTTRENILSLRVVTAQGRIVQTRKVVRKSSSGLELTQLYCGSEGTLGIVCEVAFKLWPLLKYSAGGVATFPTLRDAANAVVELNRAGYPSTLIRCELLNKEAVLAANMYCGTKMKPHPSVMFELAEANSKLRLVTADFKQIRHVFTKTGRALSVQLLLDEAKRGGIWEARRGCFIAAMTYRGNGRDKILPTDVCVPVSHLALVMSKTEEDYAALGVPCIMCAHIADGNFHTATPFRTEEELKKARALECRMIQRAQQVGGTMSGEHGIGVEKVRHVLNEHGAAHIEVQERIKKVLDPDNLMNPGVFYPVQQRLYPTAKL